MTDATKAANKLALDAPLAFAFAFAFTLGVALGGCSAPRSGPPEAPITIVAVPSASASPSGSAAQAAAGNDDRLAVDGVKLGSPIATLLARAPYAHPCDVDPIDHGAATLFFWAAGPCRDAPSFPNETSVVILTTRGPGTTDETLRSADAARAITLIAWAGGTYFDDRTHLHLRIGDSAARAVEALGEPTNIATSIRIIKGVMSKSRTLSWVQVHAYLIDEVVAVIAVGDFETDPLADITAPSERSQTLERLYQHHLRYRAH